MKQPEALFVSNFHNILYLTGFKGLSPEEREGFAVLVKDKIYLITDARHDGGQLKTKNLKLKIRTLTPNQGLVSHLKQIIKEENIEALGFEEDDLTFAEYSSLKTKLTGTKLIPVKDYFLKKREIKRSEEIEKIKKACELSDRCLSQITKTIKKGQTEREVVYKIDRWFEDQGHESAFFPIVAIDENAAIPHYDTKENGTKKVSDNCTILIDFGAKYKNYCSDETRMIFFGKPNSEILNTYNLLLSAQETTIKEIPKLKKTKEIDKFCRGQLRKNNLPDFPHSTGHGVGLEVHELPKISKKSNDKIIANQVFTIEPGIYIPGKFGMRIEDIVLINKTLKPVVLTQITRRPYCI